MKKSILVLSLILIVIFATSLYIVPSQRYNNPPSTPPITANGENESGTMQAEAHPMAIEALRQREYPANDIIIEETLRPESNYNRYIASYRADGFKIFGLLTVPSSPRPANGYPTIIFLHGYLPPKTYITTRDYIATQDGLARSGFITFKPDHRGHGNSEGVATGAHFSETYVVDTLFAISSFKKYKDTDPEKIGIWGHSNGGEIGLRTMVASKEVKAGVFWAGVVGSFEDMLETYNDRIPFMRRTSDLELQYGKPSSNPAFWNTIDPYTYLKDISGPVQLHHGTGDDEVPVELSRRLKEELEKEAKSVELYEYQGADHNLNGQAFTAAMQRSIDFFKKYL